MDIKKFRYIIYFLIVVGGGVAIYLCIDLFLMSPSEFYYVDVYSNNVVFETDERFLSVALDVSFMRCFFHKFTDSDWKKLEILGKLLSPAYIRFGGTDADRLIFDADATTRQPLENVDCTDYYDEENNIILTGEDWIKLNKFAQAAGLNLILDLNVLLRKDSGWNSSNAEVFIKFSEEHGFPLDFQLGNEPNSFPHVFGTDVPAWQLAWDFQQLRQLLQLTTYEKSKVIGPDVTRPREIDSSSLDYLEEFLWSEGDVDVASWHQYYLNGRDATLDDFLNPKTLDVLPHQIKLVSNVVRELFKTMPIWISETSSAYGGGAPGLSERFVAAFLWLDKLGVAARYNISVVIRQSLFKDHYALVSDNMTPRPDYWISLLYKNLVGRKVLNLRTEECPKTLRFYCHCLHSNSTLNGTIVLYGMNMSNKTELVVPSGISIAYPVYSYIFKPEFGNLRSKNVLLNDQRLVFNETETAVVAEMIKMKKGVTYPLEVPSYSIGFWVLNLTIKSACQN